MRFVAKTWGALLVLCVIVGFTSALPGCDSGGGQTTQYKPIELTIDEKAGTAHVRVAGLIEASAQPIKNPVTGRDHRARVALPKGFEYAEAEYVAGTAKATGPIELDLLATHAHIAKINWSQNGVVR